MITLIVRRERTKLFFPQSEICDDFIQLMGNPSLVFNANFISFVYCTWMWMLGSMITPKYVPVLYICKFSLRQLIYSISCHPLRINTYSYLIQQQIIRYPASFDIIMKTASTLDMADTGFRITLGMSRYYRVPLCLLSLR